MRAIKSLAFATVSTFAILASLPSHAVLLRDDVAALEGGIANAYDLEGLFPFIGALMEGGQNFCTGTLVNARMVVTAAHCFFVGDVYTGAGLVANGGVSFASDVGAPGARIHAISGISIHPGYDGVLDFTRNDAALVSLRAPVRGVRPPIMTMVNPETGRLGYVVGYGTHGTGASGTLGYDGKRRWGTNTVEYVGTNGELDAFAGFTAGADTHDLIAMRFDDPADGTSAQGTEATDREAGTAPGDSGGPLLGRDDDGSWVLLGILSGGYPIKGVSIQAGNWGYGTTSFYTPLADVLAFLTPLMPRLVQAKAGDGDWFDTSQWIGGVVPDNEDGDADSVGRYFYVELGNPGTTTLTGNAEIDMLDVVGENSRLAIESKGKLSVHGEVAVDAGGIDVLGALHTYMLTVNGGTLSGGGLIGGLDGEKVDMLVTAGVVAPGGREFLLSPGMKPATLTVDGAARLGPGATLAARIGPDGADRLDAKGALVMDGTRLLIGAVAGEYRDAAFAVATGAEGSVQITAGAAVLRNPDGADFAFDPENGVRLSGVSFSRIMTSSGLSIGTAPRAYAESVSSGPLADVARHLDAARPEATGERAAAFGRQNVMAPDTLQDALAGMVPVQAAAARQGAYRNFSMMHGAIQDRIDTLRTHLNAGGSPLMSRTRAPSMLTAYAPIPGGYSPRPQAQGRFLFADNGGPWIAVGGRRGTADRDGLTPKRESDSYIVSGGFDVGLTPSILAGLGLNYARTETAMGQAGRAQAEDFGGFVHATWIEDAVQLSGFAGTANTSYEARRAFTFGGTPMTADLAGKGWTYGAGLGGSVDIDAGGVTATPFARAMYVQQNHDPATERTDGGMGLSFARTRIATLHHEIGLSLATSFAAGAGVVVAPTASVSWLRDTPLGSRSLRAGLTGTGTSFAVDMPKDARDRAGLGAGLTATIHDNTALSLRYDAEVGARERSHALGLSLRHWW